MRPAPVPLGYIVGTAYSTRSLIECQAQLAQMLLRLRLRRLHAQIEVTGNLFCDPAFARS